MTIRYDQYGSAGVLALGGDLRGEQAARDYRKAVGDALGAGNVKALVVDFAGARFIDSGGLEALIWSCGRVGGDTRSVHLAGLDGNCHKIFEMTRLDDQFELYPDVQAALKAIA